VFIDRCLDHVSRHRQGFNDGTFGTVVGHEENKGVLKLSCGFQMS
jgi:hypothetical protein